MNKNNGNVIDLRDLIPILFDSVPDKKIPEPEEINTWIDLNSRKLYVNDDITEATVDYVAYYIQRWNEDDKDIAQVDRVPIRVYINTNGGCLISTMFICDLIQISRTPVWTIVQGNAYSGGGLILVSGHRRIAHKNSTILIHRGSFGAGGNANSAYDTVEFYNNLDKRVEKFFIDNTRISEEKFAENKRREWFIFSEEALELGIVDEIATEVI
jgi:ATP-dependent Clp endopeptidase proteolytic subunit ClpP